MAEFTIKEILSHFKDSKFVGDPETLIFDVISITDSGSNKNSNSLSWINDKNAESSTALPELGLLILTEKAFQKLKGCKCNFLISSNPRASFVQLLALKFSKKRKTLIEDSAVVPPSTQMGKDCYIGHNVVIENNVKIGNKTEIFHNTVIMEGTIIGNEVKIGCNCTIGNFGFGYEKDEDGNYSVLHHLGNVVIEDLVEIGNNTAIDRAVLGSTIIRKNAKIDNLVHIAHGVEVGENSLIIANAMIAGSVTIGKNSWIAPSASILNKKKIGENTVIGMGAVVLKDVVAGETVVGNPAKPINKK